MKRKLANLRKYSFCKSHSYSYAQLVYKLAYQKAHNPTKFWKSTIKNIKSSYKKWVHLYQAKCAGVDVDQILNNDNNISIYAKNRRKKIENLRQLDQLRKYGYWEMKTDKFFPGCYFYKKTEEEYYFSGIIASLKIFAGKNKYKAVLFICVGKNKYIEIVSHDTYYNKKFIGIKGRATLLDPEQQTYNAHVAVFF